MKAIIIDDETDALSNFLVSVIDDGLLEYKMFKNPLSALEYTGKNPVDAAFLDINMPEMNGVDLAEKLIAVIPKIRIVFISGYTQDEKAIRQRLGDNLKGFCYKPYGTDYLFGFIKQISDEIGDGKKVSVRTFGAFGLFIDNKPVKFTAAKSKELLALLVEKNGAHISMGEAIACLWPDKNADLAKILWRDAVWRLRQTLTDFGLKKLVEFGRAQAAIRKDNVQCDYWDFLSGVNMESYGGSYMPEYEWSIETQSRLDVLSGK